MNKNKAYVIFVAAFLAVRNLLSFLFTFLIDRTAYHFDMFNDLMIPMLLAAVIGYIFIYKRK
ncbi:MAG: hypothetical protein IIZ28_05050 [Erysipelotrichaceae bacterium]|nr:hypothetical protein [Erysipelotrichaceae bacterium]